MTPEERSRIRREAHELAARTIAEAVAGGLAFIALVLAAACIGRIIAR